MIRKYGLSTFVAMDVHRFDTRIWFGYEPQLLVTETTIQDHTRSLYATNHLWRRN